MKINNSIPNWFCITPEIVIHENPRINGFVMGMCSKRLSLSNSFCQTILLEDKVDRKYLFDYSRIYCEVRDSLINDIIRTCGMSPSYSLNKASSGVKYPPLTAVQMDEDSKYLSHFSYPYSFFNSYSGEVVTWNEMWKTEALDYYEYENCRKNLCHSHFLLMYSKATISQIKADIQKITRIAKLPQIREQILIRTVFMNQKMREQKRSWCMMNSGGWTPSITVMCALLEVDDDYVNSIVGDSSRVQEFSAMIGKQRERQEERDEKIRKENEMRKQRDRRIRYNFYNRHTRDARISCTDETYILDGKNIDSIRFVVNSLFPRFETQERVLKYSTIKGISVEALRKQWNEKGAETSRKTKVLLENIEKYYKEENVTRSTEFLQFLDFAKSVNLKPYRSSWQIFDEARGLGGTIDFVTKDASSQELVLYSFTTKDYVVSNGLPIKQNEDGECAKTPIANIPNTSFYKFALELSLYKFILEEFYNFSVSELRLGVFSENNAKGYIIRMPYLKDEIERILDARNDVIF